MSTFFNSASMVSRIGVQPVPGSSLTGATPVGGDKLKLARTHPGHFYTGGSAAPAEAAGEYSFENAMLKALDGVNAMQMDSSEITEAMLIDPDSVDAHDVTIAMAKANMSLNITRTVLDRIVRAWKDIINTR